jgi:hypothetical protein
MTHFQGRWLGVGVGCEWIDESREQKEVKTTSHNQLSKNKVLRRYDDSEMAILS